MTAEHVPALYQNPELQPVHTVAAEHVLQFDEAVQAVQAPDETKYPSLHDVQVGVTALAVKVAPVQLVIFDGFPAVALAFVHVSQSTPVVFV